VNGAFYFSTQFYNGQPAAMASRLSRMANEQIERLLLKDSGIMANRYNPDKSAKFIWEKRCNVPMFTIGYNGKQAGIDFGMMEKTGLPLKRYALEAMLNVPLFYSHLPLL
jgi:hypothetical protein